MISTKGLKTNLLPNLYTKNITLDTTFKNTASPWFATKKKNYTPTLEEQVANLKKTKNPSSTNMATLLMSLKMVQDKNTSAGIAKLLSTELKETFKIKMYQITDKSVYKATHALLKKSINDKKNNFPVAQENMTMLELTMEDFLSDDTLNQGANVQKLEDGTLITEMTHSVQFDFEQSSDFLGYLTVVCVEHEDFEEVFFGSLSGDIVILDGRIQTEGVVFKISLDQGGRAPSIFRAKYGRPGDTWVGDVHSHEGRFMAGPVHTSDAHPFLDTYIVPVRKYVDNRVKDKIQKNVINITQAFEKVSSLTVKMPSQKNLLDLQAYKKKSYMSDIFLSQAGLVGPNRDNPFNGTDIQGSFFIDKEQLFKGNSSFSFLFQNVKAMAKDPNFASYVSIFYDEIYKLGKLEKLTLFEDGELLNTINFSLQRNQTSISKLDPESVEEENKKCSITKENFVIKNKEGIDQFSFKRYASKKTTGKSTYKVVAEYKDPTVAFVKQMVPLLTSTIEQINLILSRTQLSNGFSSLTGRIKESLAQSYISELDPTDAIDDAGNIRDLIKLLTTSNFWVYFYNQNTTSNLGNEVYAFFLNSTNVLTATSDSLTVAATFLNDLKAKIVFNLKSFEKNSVKTNATAAQNQYGAQSGKIKQKSSFSDSIIKVENSTTISLSDYAYNFLGEIPTTDSPMITIKRDQYKSRVLILATEYISSPDKLNLEATFQTKYGKKEKMSDNLFSYLTIPKYLTTLRESIILPKTVMSVKQESTNMESIFLGILKLNSEVFVNNFTDGNHSAEMREDLNDLLANRFNAKLIDDSEILATEMNSQKQTPQILGPGGNLGFSNEVVSPAPTNDEFIVQKKNLKTKNVNNNFILLSVLNKLVMSNFADDYNSVTENQTFVPRVMKGSFKTTPRVADDAPVQVKILNLISDDGGTFKDYKTQNEVYIQKGVINPLLLCYYWLLHQNIMQVEYLSEFDSSSQSVFLKNQQNPYAVGKSLEIDERNTKKPIWKKINLQILDNMITGDKILCRLVRYQSDYIDENLVNKLKLPLYNNYFIIEG